MALDVLARGILVASHLVRGSGGEDAPTACPEHASGTAAGTAALLKLITLALSRVILQLAVESCLADAEQTCRLQLVAIQFRYGVEDGLPFQFRHGNDSVLAVA